MDNLVNVSPNWIASPARNAATDAADIVVYNPAATVMLSEGFNVNIGNQTLFRTPSHTYDLGMGMKTSTQNGSDPFLPNLYAAYSKNKWSVFTGIFVSGGGATLNYPVGSITTDMIGFQAVMSTEGAYSEVNDQYLKAGSYYLTTTVGGAYKFSNVVTGSLSLRYLNGSNNTQAGFTMTSSPIEMPDMPLKVDFDETATGMGAVAGVFIHASSKFDLSFRYESKVEMNFKTKVNKDDLGLVTNGSKSRRDLPSVFAMGASYKINSKLTALMDMNYYFQENAEWGTTMNANGETVSLSKTAGNAISYCLALNYRVNEKLGVSVGGGYTDYMYNDMDVYYTHVGVFETVHNDNMNLNLGCSYQVAKKVSLTAGYMNTSWAKDTKVKALMISPDSEVIVNNSMNVIAIGANINF